MEWTSALEAYDTWELVKDPKVVSKGEEAWQGKAIGGYGHGDDWSPTEYAEGYVEVVDAIKIELKNSVSARGFSRRLVQWFKSAASGIVTDARGFGDAIDQVLGNSAANKMIGKLMADAIQPIIKFDPEVFFEELGNLIEDPVHELIEDDLRFGWSFDGWEPEPKGMRGLKTKFKASPSGWDIFLTVEVGVKVIGLEPFDDRDGESDDYRYAAGKGGHVPDSVLKLVEPIHKALHTLSGLLDGAKRKADDAFYDYEDARSAAEKKWESAGNHPDDFNDPRQNPDADAWEKAGERIKHVLSIVTDNLVPLQHLDRELERVMKKLK